MKSSRAGFTLIELLVVIAIIAVLSVVVVLSLNPAELLRQSRDANRLSDLSTLNSALALYTTDQAGIAGFSLGNASSVYVSLPDSSSTCGTWNLPALPSGYTYTCSTSTSSKNINTTGWIPVNFSNISGGAPFSNLPIDNVNQSSTGLYYTYYSNGSQFMVTAIPESQKQKSAYGTKPIVTNFPSVLANGSNLSISPLFNGSGLVGYWNFDEGTGTMAYDLSGNGNNGIWNGSTTNGSYYVSGKIGYGGIFGGNTTYVSVSNQITLSSAFTVSGWINPVSLSAQPDIFSIEPAGGMEPFRFNIPSNTHISIQVANSTSNREFEDIQSGFNLANGAWGLVTFTFKSGAGAIYVNGANVDNHTFVMTSVYGPSATTYLGVRYPGNNILNGSLDDVRLYNRALSPAEIQALYNEGR